MKLTENQKRKILKLINERVGELLDEIKGKFNRNSEDFGLDSFKIQFKIIEELRVMKVRVWDYK